MRALHGVNIGTMQPSDFSSAYMPIVRLLPSWVGRECWPDTDEISQVPTSASHLAGRMLPSRLRTGSAPRNSTRFAARYPAHGLPCERFKLSLAASPCITRGRGGWLGLTPWKTCTSYPLPASWRTQSWVKSTNGGSKPTVSAAPQQPDDLDAPQRTHPSCH